MGVVAGVAVAERTAGTLLAVGEGVEVSVGDAVGEGEGSGVFVG